MKRYIGIALMLTLAGLGFRLFLALRLPNDEPDDGRLYVRIAINVVAHRSYSIETEEPYSPTYIRVPGYPLFLAGVYSLFGAENNRAVRAIQAVIDTITCLLVGLLAWAWCPQAWPHDKRRRVALIALALAVFCPFPAIYVATILTETSATLLATACALAAMLGMKTSSKWKRAGWWLAAGLFGGAVTMVRPDGGMFVAAVGATLVLVGARQALAQMRARKARDDRGETAEIGRDKLFAVGIGSSLAPTVFSAVMLSLGFALALAPWTIRNAQVFSRFQPISPSQANMPGEFVPQGYIRWLRTWVDDARYTQTLEFPLDTGLLRIEHAPDYAFDSPEERERVAALLDRYNHGPSVTEPKPDPPPAPAPTAEQQSKADPAAEKATSEDAATDEEESDEADAATDEEESDESSDDEDSPEENVDEKPAVEMTPDIDAGFAELARERIARNPLRYYLIVPMRRAASLWFDTHSQYYPFQGELFPLSELDWDFHQQYWLPLFMFLTLAYTALGVAGMWVMWKHVDSRPWLLMLLLLTLPRIAFLSGKENPEPRYVVELFTFVSAAAAIALVSGWERLKNLRHRSQPST
ncbi:MAG TPA: glycosyltransferase family 39 protein [Blastocatellia bacterium]|nr:glycosyltransferase family 39 protein [Blastocatellia bacterium]